jgi:hypothetical protein
MNAKGTEWFEEQEGGSTTENAGDNVYRSVQTKAKGGGIRWESRSFFRIN